MQTGGKVPGRHKAHAPEQPPNTAKLLGGIKFPSDEHRLASHVRRHTCAICDITPAARTWSPKSTVVANSTDTPKLQAFMSAHSLPCPHVQRSNALVARVRVLRWRALCALACDYYELLWSSCQDAVSDPARCERWEWQR